MRVGVDIDGVLANFNESMIERVIKVTGRDLFPARPFDIPCWDYPQFYGYTAEENTRVWTDIIADPRFWRSLPKYPTTREDLHYLSQLAARGDEVYFITSRPGTFPKTQTEHWLQLHGYQHLPTVLISSEKGECCHALKLDYYIDDRWENCINVTDRSNAQVSLVDRGWNQKAPEVLQAYGITRVTQVAGFAGRV